MQNKFKHNKKRNTAFLFEALVKELAKAAIATDKPRQATVSSIIREFFRKGTVLEKELTLFKQLSETKEFPKDVAEKLLTETKHQHDLMNEEEIFIEQSKLISKVNKLLGVNVYDNFVPNYKTLATVSQIFSKQVEPKKRVLLERDLLEIITSEVQAKKVVLERVDTLVLKRFIERFNEEYSSKLLSEQKVLLNKYINTSEEDVELKIYLNEEIGRLKTEIEKAKATKLVSENVDLNQKISQVHKILSEARNKKIDEDLIKKVMFIQEFVSEVNK
jgi:hypothetical protein